MPFFLLSYHGKRTWNVSEARVVRARDEAGALRQVAEPAEWRAELLTDDPPSALAPEPEEPGYAADEERWLAVVFPLPMIADLEDLRRAIEPGEEMTLPAVVRRLVLEALAFRDLARAS